jgi:hypothetical protein
MKTHSLWFCLYHDKDVSGIQVFSEHGGQASQELIESAKLIVANYVSDANIPLPEPVAERSISAISSFV